MIQLLTDFRVKGRGLLCPAQNGDRLLDIALIQSFLRFLNRQISPLDLRHLDQKEIGGIEGKKFLRLQCGNGVIPAVNALKQTDQKPVPLCGRCHSAFFFAAACEQSGRQRYDKNPDVHFFHTHKIAHFSINKSIKTFFFHFWSYF